ncbi:MAG TPA: sensor histidine kinase [Actinomycetota bacterium]|nr:sensor histidine kinase [Actinomycetota bacterium]
MPRMAGWGIGRADRLVWGLWGAMALLWASTLVIVLIDHPRNALLALLGLPAAVYALVGGLVARRRPENPIGWLFCALGLSLVLWVFGLAYAQAGLGGEAGLGPLPGAAVAAWAGTLVPLVVPWVALPTFMLLFPDGRLRSRRWRVVIVVVLLGGVLLLLAAVGTIDQYSGDLPIAPPSWLAHLPGIGGAVAVGLVLEAAAAFAGLGALVLRFRSATEEQRQPLRLLVAVISTMAIATVTALVAVFGSGQADWAWVPLILATLVDMFGIFVGIPLAAAAAVLTYGLYDVGLVMKKTVVYVVLVIFFVILVGLISLTLSPFTFMGGPDAGTLSRSEALVARIVTGAAVFALLLVFSFRPGKRVARRLVYGRRATRYEAMSEFSERLGDAYSTEDVLPRMAEIVRASTGAEVARVWLHVGGELRVAASSPHGVTAPPPIPVVSGEAPTVDGLRTFPVRDRGELLGALTVAMPAAEPLSKDGERLVADLAGQAGLMLRNVRLIEELQESRRRIVAAQDERARKLERDIHDGAQQQLVALSVKLGLVEQLAVRDPEKARAVLGELKADAADALDNLRDLARGIYPPLLADQGLVAALDSQARKSTVEVRLVADGVGRYPQEVEAAVYFCALEALQNVAKYAQATSARIRLTQSDGHLAFEIVDDGVGFDLSRAHGSGLTNMRDRIEAVGGGLEVVSRADVGTTVKGRIPVQHAMGSGEGAP